jgi:putative DNA primase/helicase
MLDIISVNPEVKETIQRLLPGSKVIKLKGYSGGNKNYSSAKHPMEKWKKAAGLTNEEIENVLSHKNWIGATIPAGRVVIDVDNAEEGLLLRSLLEAERVIHHAIKTPNGYQFIFSKTDGLQISQVSKFFSAVGIRVDTKPPLSGYIVWPTKNTEGRYIITESRDKLDELPAYLKPVWNSNNTKNYVFPIPLKEPGNRNNSLYDFARRLKVCGVPNATLMQAMELIYKHFVYDKADFPESELKALIRSALGMAVSHTFNTAYQAELDTGPVDPHTIPYPYKASEKALYMVRGKASQSGDIDEGAVMVARYVPYVKREMHNVEHPQVFYEIQWEDKGRKLTELVPAAALATKKEMMPLADKGFPCNDINVRWLILYFDKVLAFSDIPRGQMVERLGHIKDNFVHPLLIEDIEILPSDEGEKQLLEAFMTSGNVEQWKEQVFAKVKNYPRALFLVLSSFASIVLHDLKVDPFVVDMASSTSQGKTTALRIAASVWGTQQLINEFNATKVSIERKAAFLNSFPLLLDDSRKADERILQSIVYTFSGGRSKGRGSLSGSQREFTWKNIMITTGEVSMTDYSAKAGGVAARVISLTSSPFEGADSSFFTELYQALEGNCGGVGLEFIRKYEQRKTELLPDFLRTKDHYMKKAYSNEVLTRLSLYYSTVHFTGKLLNLLLNLEIDLTLLDKLFDELAQENKAIDKPRQLLEELLQDLDADREAIYYEYRPKSIVKAIYKAGVLYLTPAYLKSFLGPEMKMMRNEWRKRGFTFSFDVRGRPVDYQQVKHEGKNFQGIPINQQVVQELGFDFRVDATG